MKKKMVYALALIMSLALITGGASLAAMPPESEIMPMYVYVEDIDAYLSIGAGIATCEGVIYTENPTSNISLTITLLKKNGSNWSTVTSWSKSVQNADNCTMSKNYNVSVGTYKVLVSSVVTNSNGTKEYASVESAVVNFGVAPN